MPAGGLEVSGPLLEAHPRNHSVQRLSVEVDHPHDVAQALGGRIGDRLPDVALIEFGVTDHGDVARGRPISEVRIDVSTRRGSKQRGRGPEPDGSGGKVDRVGVFCPGGIRLQAPLRPQRGQVGPVQISHQVLDGVEDRGSMRLDRDAVVAVEVMQEECGHHADDRRTRGLVSPYFHTVDVGAFVVCVINHAHREPEHAALNGFECAEFLSRLVDHARSCSLHLGGALFVRLEPSAGHTLPETSERTLRHERTPRARCRSCKCEAPGSRSGHAPSPCVRPPVIPGASTRRR